MRFLRQWLPVVLWTALILSASNNTFSSDQSRWWAQRFLGFAIPEILLILIRKSAHIAEYGILAYLAWRAHRGMAVPLLIVLAISSMDEWLQSRTSARTGTVWDVVLDVCAAVIMVAILESQSLKVSKSQRSAGQTL